MTATTRAVVGAGGVAVLWLVLAMARAGVTYHVAPALVVWAAPYLHGLRDHARGHRMVATLVGTVVALTATGLLVWLGQMDGPWLVGGSATGETVLVTAVATATSLAIGALAPVAPSAPPDV